MARKLAKAGKKGAAFRIKEDEPRLTPLDLERNKMESRTEGVSVSLKYFRQETECFSDWQAGELKKFSAVLQKIEQFEASTLMSYKPLCAPHKGAPAEGRFARHAKLSEDLKFFEIKVDPSNKARMHGVFVGSVFFLVWLDRNHAVYPE